MQVNKDVADILKYVYQDWKAYYEVNAAIYSGYYDDESVMLRDLLFLETSPLYKMESFKKYGSPEGVFKKRFFVALSKGDYPVLKEAMGLGKPDNGLNNKLTTMKSTIEALSVARSADTTQEIYSNSSGTMIYFPYSENFGSNFTTAYFDNINTDPFGNFATVVPADREADSAPGNEPYRRKTYDASGNIIWTIAYKAVTVNDAYAEIKPTHIVGVIDGILGVDSVQPPIITPINRVYSGWSRIKSGNQQDRLISFTGNGGGSEIKISRISGYLQMADQQVTNFTGDVHTIEFKRKDIRKGRWKRTYAVWDPDWKTDNLEQVYAVYEDDNKAQKTFTGTLTTTATIPIPGVPGGTTTATRTLTYNIVVSTQDQLLTQRKQDRYSYFRDAKNDQGWGFQMCDDKGCRYDDTFLPAGQYWPKYDEGSAWGFTWPYKTY